MIPSKSPFFGRFIHLTTYRTNKTGFGGHSDCRRAGQAIYWPVSAYQFKNSKSTNEHKQLCINNLPNSYAAFCCRDFFAGNLADRILKFGPCF
jgi:hypothetical protein